MKEYVVACCHHEAEVLLVLKDRPAKMAGRLNLPGGKVEPEDESPEHAALRELKEEAGLHGTRTRYHGKIIVEKDAFGSNAVIHCIGVQVDRHEPISPRPGETETVAWHTWDCVVTDWRLMPNLRIIVPLIRAGVAGWVIDDSLPSWGKTQHEVRVQVPTYQQLESNKG